MYENVQEYASVAFFLRRFQQLATAKHGHLPRTANTAKNYTTFVSSSANFSKAPCTSAFISDTCTKFQSELCFKVFTPLKPETDSPLLEVISPVTHVVR